MHNYCVFREDKPLIVRILREFADGRGYIVGGISFTDGAMKLFIRKNELMVPRAYIIQWVDYKCELYPVIEGIVNDACAFFEREKPDGTIFQDFPLTDAIRGYVRNDVATSKAVVNSVFGRRGSDFLQKTLHIKQPTKIKNVIFNNPATIVFWEDGTKTVVKAKDEDFDPEKGLAMAIVKKVYGNEGNYYNEIKKWLPKEPPEDELWRAFVALATYGKLGKKADGLM